MIFEDVCGWMREPKTGRLYFFLPEEVLHDEQLLEDCLYLLADNRPTDTEEPLIH